MNLRSFLEALTVGGRTALTSSAVGLMGILGYSVLTEEKVIYLPMALMTVAILSVLLGSFRGGMAAGAAGWLHGGAVAAFYLLFVILVRMTLFPDVDFNMASLAFTFSVLLAGCAGGVIGINLKFMRRQRIRRYLRKS